MKVKVTVKPSSKYEKIEEAFDGSLKIWVKEPAKEGRANKSVVITLANYYNVKKKDIKIISGFNRKIKLINIKKE